MSNRYQHLAAPGVRTLVPYQPGKPIDELEREYGVSNIIKLASNENPLGASPMALAALKSLDEIALYPDPNGFKLKAKLAALHDVSPDCITLGNGSNDVLVMLTETFLTPEHAALFSQYAFAVYPIATQAAGAESRIVPALPLDHPEMPLGHDLSGFTKRIDDKVRLIFIANPNNPTGTWLEPDALRQFIDSVPKQTIVVIDEAYVEYAPPGTENAAAWLTEYPNLVISRTFSKAYGLAGLRIGYTISHPDISDLLNRIRQSFNVNSAALIAAEHSLDDHDFIQRTYHSNLQGLKQLKAGVETLGLSYVPSRGNFLLIHLGQPAMPVFEKLLKQAVIVRPVANYGLNDLIRVTVGTEAQNTSFLNALKQSLNEN